jgi:hypothetical protein
MKKPITLIFAAGVLTLAGCCTPSHDTKWEYKIVREPNLFSQITKNDAQNGNAGDVVRQGEEKFLNDLGKDGWIYIKDYDGTYYFRRPVK